MIEQLLKERILILDGAMGTMIQQYALTEEDFRGTRFAKHASSLKGNNDILSITRPDVVQAIHEQYLEAGADIIETNTFSANKISQGDYQLEDAVYDLNVASAQLAKKACALWTKKNPTKPRFVAGAIGPTTRAASLSPDVNNPGARSVTFDDLVTIYAEQVKGLADGGVDLFLVETIFDTLNAKAALYAIQEWNEQAKQPIPVMVSGTITDNSGRTLSGQTTDAFLVSVSHAPLLSIGLNCALGAAQLRPYLEILHEQAPYYISVYPNAGLPNALGQYDQSPEEMVQQLETFCQAGWVNIVGGCCGTTPAHIKAIAEKVSRYAPRQFSVPA